MPGSLALTRAHYKLNPPCVVSAQHFCSTGSGGAGTCSLDRELSTAEVLARGLDLASAGWSHCSETATSLHGITQAVGLSTMRRACIVLAAAWHITT